MWSATWGSLWCPPSRRIHLPTVYSQIFPIRPTHILLHRYLHNPRCGSVCFFLDYCHHVGQNEKSKERDIQNLLKRTQNICNLGPLLNYFEDYGHFNCFQFWTLAIYRKYYFDWCPIWCWRLCNDVHILGFEEK